jgi:hypothetical protein
MLAFDTIVALTRYHLYIVVAYDDFERADSAYIAEQIGFDVTSSSVKFAFQELSDNEHASVSHSQGKTYAKLTPDGIREVERQLQNEKSILALYVDKGEDALGSRKLNTGFIPASDRVVSLSDNQPATEIVKELERLERTLETSNEAAEALGDLRDVALEEVKTLRSMFTRKFLFVASASQYAKKALGWIAEKAGGAAVGEAAKLALAHIIKFLF